MIIALIITAVILWSSSFVGIRAALFEYSPVEIAVFRFVISSIALFLVIRFQKINLPDKKDYFPFALLGLVLFINHIALNYGIRTITAGETTLIVSSSQLFQVLLAYLFLNETISIRFLAGLFFCFSGVTIIAFQNPIGLSFNLGVVFVLLAAITNAIYFILQKPLLMKYRPLEVISYSTWIATLMLLPFGRGVVRVFSTANMSATAAVIYIGIATVVAHICWSKILSKIEASKAAVFLYTVPVMTIIIGYLWLRELPSLISCAAGAIILGGVTLSTSKAAGTEKAD
ncbi:MAG: DMT family transporter [Desulfobacterales bacterium]|jgi:drug/metabolite transporter (DMT)-like permease